MCGGSLKNFLYPPKLIVCVGGLKTETGKFLLHFQNFKSSNRCQSIYDTDIKRKISHRVRPWQHGGSHDCNPHEQCLFGSSTNNRLPHLVKYARVPVSILGSPTWCLVHMCKVQRGQSQKTATFSKLELEYSIFPFDDGKIIKPSNICFKSVQGKVHSIIFVEYPLT